MFGDPIERDRTAEAISHAKSDDDEKNGEPDNNNEGSYEDSDSSIQAEAKHLQKVIKQTIGPSKKDFDDHGLPEPVREIKNKIRQEQKEEQENSWWPENKPDHEQVQDVIQKTENSALKHIEKDEDYAINQKENFGSSDVQPVDMVNVGQELNLTLNDVDTKI